MVLEAALVLPLLLLVVFAAIEFGYAFYVKHTLQGAARTGARAAILPDATDASVNSAVSTAMQRSGLASATFTVKIKNATTNSTASVGSIAEGEPVLIEVSTPWSQFSVMGSSYITNSLSATSVMRREG
jgi:Flp pilus assembly protein TadG